MGGEDDKPEQVTNPQYTALKSLRDDMKNQRYSLANALDTGARMMGEGETWDGPGAAKDFTEEIQGRKKELPGLVDSMISAVEAELESTPEKIDKLPPGVN